MFSRPLQVMSMIMIAALALSACAKRDSNFKSRKNAAGATYVNSDQAAAADAAATASGYNTDVLQISAPQASSAGALSITSYIRVNSSTYQIVTTHGSVGTVSRTQQNFDGATFEVNGICANDVCSPYYLVLNITRNGQQIKQTAMKKYFYYSDANSSQDLILTVGAGQFMSVQDAITTLDQSAADAQ